MHAVWEACPCRASGIPASPECAMLPPAPHYRAPKRVATARGHAPVPPRQSKGAPCAPAPAHPPTHAPHPCAPQVAWRPSNHAFAAHAPTAGAGSSTAWQQQSAAAVRSAPKDPWGHAIGASNRVAADASGVHDAGSGGAPGGSGGGGGGRRVGAWRLAQLCAVYAAIAAHLLVMAYTDPLGDPSFVMLLLLFT